MESIGRSTDTRQRKFTDRTEEEVKGEIARQLAHFLISSNAEPISAELVVQYEEGSARLHLDLDKAYGKKIPEKEVWL